ncbi:hypothetical protein CYMTET_8433 [Cymbomonas tetramitiformis]|uniref:Uncharacterized protein n=1 Tax=Cymbomonas tetramitiformis TaxID=36881 RepID=A0AAE0GT94_9CHLO|nr:hypothetical protein CYMTET_8433 [Cymbomonas tetramitiformis]
MQNVAVSRLGCASSSDETVPGAHHFKGREGTRLLEDELERIQLERNRSGLLHLPCPTCAELVHGKRYQEYIASVEDEVVLAPSRLIGFEGEPPPLYMNAAPPEKAPKWTISQGLGPKSLELDKSRSGRIYKPTLRQYGVQGIQLDTETLTSGDCKYMLEAACSHHFCTQSHSESTVAMDWVERRPLYLNWDQVSNEIGSRHLQV